jgi:hypothetical protein
VGLARGTFHPPRGHGKEGASSVNGASATIPSRSSHESYFVFLLCFLCAVWGKVVVSSRLCCWRRLQYPADDGREPCRICCWYGRHPVLRTPTGQQLEWWVSSPRFRLFPSLKIDVHTQVFVSSSLHALVYSLAYSSCSSTGVFVRTCTWIIVDFSN